MSLERSIGTLKNERRPMRQYLYFRTSKSVSIQLRQYLYSCTRKCVSICAFVLINAPELVLLVLVNPPYLGVGVPEEAARLLRQYLYFFNSKASKLST